jgi:hypothetical protein
MPSNNLQTSGDQNHLSIKQNLSLFNSCILPVLTYGCEIWKSTKLIEEKLNAFENKCLRKITNTHWKEFKSNRTLREETKQELVSTSIKICRWKYLGHLLRMDKRRLHRQAFNWTLAGTRRRERPRETLRRTIIRESANINVNILDLQELAKDRRCWRDMISALCDFCHKRLRRNLDNIIAITFL